MITIHLHGPLNKLWSLPYAMNVSTPEEAIRGFSKITGALDPTPQMNGRHLIRVKGFDEAADLYKPFDGELHLYPDFTGGGGWVKIVIGAVLIVVGVILTVYGMGSIGVPLITTGLSFVLGGILELMSPAPKSDTPTYQGYLGTPQNTVKIGTRIPLCYGEQRIYGQYLSYNIMARDVNPTTGEDETATPTNNLLGGLAGGAYLGAIG